MRKKNANLILPAAAALILCALAAAAYTVLFVWSDDNTAPEISMNVEQLEVSVSAGEEELLWGVTALDKRDGDVTAGIVIDGISDITDDHTAVITYAAFDGAGNVAKASRTLKYTDYVSPVIDQNRALVFSSGSAPDVLAYMSAEDVFDGDLSRRIKATLVSDTGSLSFAGIHQVEFRVTNSMGDTAYLTLPVEVYPAGTYDASVSLNDYLVRLEKGASFRPDSYLDTVKVGAEEYSLRGGTADVRVSVDRYLDPANYDQNITVINVQTQSDVNIAQAGVYSVTYRVTVSRGVAEYVGYTRLNVVVEE